MRMVRSFFFYVSAEMQVNQDAQIMAQMDSLEAEAKSYPMIGPIERIGPTLLPEYQEASSPGFVPGIEYLDAKYPKGRIQRYLCPPPPPPPHHHHHRHRHSEPFVLHAPSMSFIFKCTPARIHQIYSAFIHAS